MKGVAASVEEKNRVRNSILGQSKDCLFFYYPAIKI